MTKNFVYLDTETTGLLPTDKIVEIAIVGMDGEVLVDSLVNPEKPIGYFASQVHGIYDDMVEDAPTIDELKDEIIEAVKGKDVVIYNSGYDMQYLPFIREHIASVNCAMKCYASFSDRNQNVKLLTATIETNYRWEGDVHRALTDALATRHIWGVMVNKDHRDKHMKCRSCEKSFNGILRTCAC